jgi:hypothetical protein
VEPVGFNATGRDHRLFALIVIGDRASTQPIPQSAIPINITTVSR